jgi:pre-mRNA-splicing factor ISY1
MFCAQALAEWQEKDEERQAALAGVTDKAARKKQQQQSGADGDSSGPQFVAYVPLPDQKAIEQMVLEKKKQELLAKYTSEALAKQQQEAKQLLNKQ